jgi:prepilin peptidase CpaA
VGAVRAVGGGLSVTQMSGVHLVALSIAAVACGFDLRTRRIPNWLTFGAAAAGIVFHAATGGMPGLQFSGAGWVVGAACLIVPYALGGMGGGDVKLVGALGAWLGAGDTFWLAMYTGIAGAIAAVVVSAWHGYLRQALSNVWLLLVHWRVNGLRPAPELTLQTSRGPRLAYAVPILAGTMVMLWLR